MSTPTPSSRAISLLLRPSPARRIARPRIARCCGAPCRRTNASSSARCSGLNPTAGGFGPRILSSSLTLPSPSHPLYYPTTYATLY
ncbi:MAG: hypothetical protein WKH64_03145 [Chloroflexia bacterium]